HDKIREALYDALRTDERAHLHERIGDALAAADGGGNTEVYALAHHHGHSANAAKALAAQLRAGDVARQHYAHLEALEFNGRAMALARDLPAVERDAVLPRITEAIADSQVATGQIDAALQAYESLLGLPADVAVQVERRRKLSILLHLRGQTRRAMQLLAEAHELMGERVPRTRAGVVWQLIRETAVQVAHTLRPPRGAPDPDPRWTVLANLSHLLSQFTGFIDLLGAVSINLRSVNLLEQRRARSAVALAYTVHGAVCVYASMLKRGTGYAAKALAIRRAEGDRWGAAHVQSTLGMTFLTAGHYAEALTHLRACRAEFEQQGDPYQWGLASMYLGYGLALTGRWDEAEA
ncbi:MAG: hypothetical protein Q7T55_09530, partial [Solirubrobacteraceae bacterium]|nr:hypothetical protein [Solirubrobacteraceae bacterium]